MDVMRHERFDHGHYHPFESPQDARSHKTPTDVTSIDELEIPNELIQLMSVAESTYAIESNYTEENITLPGLPYQLDFLEIVQLFDLKFPGRDCKVGVDV